MKTIRFFVDRLAYPVWLFDDDHQALGNKLVPEVKADPQLIEDLNWIQHAYDTLFLYTSPGMSWWGFDSPEAARKYADMVEATAERLKTVLGGTYIFVDDADRHPGIGRGPGQFHGGDDGRL